MHQIWVFPSSIGFYIASLVIGLMLNIGLSTSSSGQTQEWIEQFNADEEFLLKKYQNASSPKTISRMLEFYSLWKTIANQKKLGELPRERQIDAFLLINYTSRMKDHYRSLQLEHKNTSQLLPFLRQIDILIDEYDTVFIDDSKKIAELTDRISDKLEDYTLKSSAVILSKNQRVLVDAIESLEEVRRKLSYFHEFHQEDNPLYVWWVGEANAKLQRQLAELNQKLRTKLEATSSNSIPNKIKPIGREEIENILQNNFIGCTVPELMNIVDDELLWCEGELEKAATEMGAETWQKAVAQLGSQFQNPAIRNRSLRDLNEEIISFIEKNNLVTIPLVARETQLLRLTHTNPRERSSLLGRRIEPSNSNGQKMTYGNRLAMVREGSPVLARPSVCHQFIPGRHLLNFMNRRTKPYRQVFGTSFTTEGWSTYWEFLLLERGLCQTPEDRFGMLYARMVHSVLAAAVLRLHNGQITSSEATSLLVEKLGIKKENAARLVHEILLGPKGPLYHASFLIGALQYRQLYREMVDSGKMTNREFHDAILKENNIPVEILRAKLQGITINRDSEPVWKFTDAN